MVSPSPLALRYTKEVRRQLNVVVGNTTETVGGTVYYKPAQEWGLQISPRKFSNVAKVRFYVAARNRNASTDAVGTFLRIWVNSVTNNNADPALRTLPTSGGTTKSNDVGFTGALGFFSSSIVDRFFARQSSPSFDLPANSSSGSSHVYVVEFDIFNAMDQDFFACWNAADDPDEYMMFQAAIGRASGPTNADIEFCAFAADIIQAPGIQNDTATYIRVWPGTSDGITGLTTFDSAATVHDQIRGAWRFPYRASEWDGITSVHLVLRWENGNNNSGITARLHRLTSDTQATASSTLLVSLDLLPAGSGTSLAGFARSEDFFDQFVDGEEYVFEIRHNAAAGTVDGFDLQLEIVQQNCTKTVSTFHCAAGALQSLGGFNSSTPQITQFVGYISPDFFRNYPDSLFTARQFVAGIVHDNASNAPECEMLQNSNLTEDQNGPSGATGTTSTIAVATATPINTFPRWVFREDDLVTDPINFAGDRKLIFRYDGSWAAGNDEHPGVMYLRYAYAVPNTEILDLGPLFPVGEFDPEGCASTAAGLGDPGVLVITNGSSIPKKFNPVAGNIEDAGLPVPFEGEYPNGPGAIVIENSAVSPTGGIVPGRYEYRYTFRNCCTGKESDPNPDTFVIDSAEAGASPAAIHNISFANVRIPDDPQICEICIYRSVKDGAFPVMAKVGCFNIDETSVFVDDVVDTELDFTANGLSILNAPMPCVPVVVEYRNRLFGMGDIPQLAPAGTVSVENGSKYVLGDGSVEWGRCLEGKFIQIGTDCRAYEIERILPPAEGNSPAIARLKLVEEYEGQTETGLTYHICGHQNRLFFSEPLEPEYWPNINFLDVEPGDGDKLMGAASNFDALIICKTRKTYLLRFRENPLTEVIVPSRISTDIGCIAPRSFAQVENGTVWLSDRGLALFDGRGVQHIEASDRFNLMLIDPENPRYIRRDGQGRVIDAVGVFYPRREQYLLLLPTVQTVRGANLMLVWDTSLDNITIYEFCQEFQSMVVALDADGNQRVYLGDVNGFVWIFDIGDNDGAGFPGATGTVRGAVTDAGIELGASFLEDSAASFLEGGLPQLAALSGTEGLSGAFGGSPEEAEELGLAGVCVFTRAVDAALDDPWTVRTIYAATPTRLYVTPSWGEDAPTAGDDYMIAPIEFLAQFKSTNFATDDLQKRNWNQVLTFAPEEVSSMLRIELLSDFSASDEDELTVTDSDGEIGAGRTFDLQFVKGRIRRPVGRSIFNFMRVRMRNFAPDEPIRIINHVLLSEPRTQ